MNLITILSPRWHDRVVLIADHRLTVDNLIHINHKDFPEPLYLSGKRAREFPLEQLKTKQGGEMPVRAVPIAELIKEVLEI